MTTLPTTGISLSATLTTTFTPAPSCTTDFYTDTASNYYSIGGPLASTCFPSGWASTSQYFSPGVCPEGYTQACSSTLAIGTDVETFATCCPSHYSCYGGTLFNFLGQACASAFTRQVTTTVTDGSALTVMLATLHASTEAVNGYGVSIRYNAKDFSTSVPSSTSTSTTSPPTSSPTSNSSSTSTSSSPSSTSTTASPSPGLSTGAKAGIGVGAAAVVIIALIALGFFIMGKRRRARVPDYAAVHEADSGKGVRMEMAPAKGFVHEIYTLPTELDGRGGMLEMEGTPGKGIRS